MVRNKVAAAPNIDVMELRLRNRLLHLFARIEPCQFKSVWKESVKICKDYWKIYLEELEEGVEEDSDEEGSGGSDGGDSGSDESDLRSNPESN